MSLSEAYLVDVSRCTTIRADIDYGFAEAKTTYGRIGVKVWINKGEIMPEGYEGMAQDTRLGDQDCSAPAARRPDGGSRRLARIRSRSRRSRGSRSWSSAASPVAAAARRGRAGEQNNVERPRTNEAATSAEGRQQPVVEPEVEVTPEAVADARYDHDEGPDGGSDEARGHRRRGVVLLPKKTKFRKYPAGAPPRLLEGPDDRERRRLPG